MKFLTPKIIYLIFIVLFLSSSLLAGLYLVRLNQETRRGATCIKDGGGCGDPICCRSWEVYQDGCCKSTSGCQNHSDCANGKLCVQGVCQDATPPACLPCSGNETKCEGQYYKYCDGSCWREDGSKNSSCQDQTTPGAPSGTQQDPCVGAVDSGCTTGGRGGVDCANCRQTGGQVKQCQNSTWYCCYSDGNCYQGTAQKAILCSGSTITNNSGKTVTGNIYQGCYNGNKIGTFTLADKQSKTASDCNQIDVPGYCGVCNSANCQSTPPTQPPSVPTATPTPRVTTTTTPSLTPTSTPTPLTPTSTPAPNATATPVVTTATPTATYRPPSYISPTPPILPQAGINLPSKALTIFGTVVTLLGLLVLL